MSCVGSLSQGTPGRKSLRSAQAPDPTVISAGHTPAATSSAQRQEQNMELVGGSPKGEKVIQARAEENQAKNSDCVIMSHHHRC